MSAAETERVGTRRGSPQTLVAALYTLIVTGLVLTNVINGPLRVLLIAPLVGFLPGYAILDSVFPVRTAGRSSIDEHSSSSSRTTIGWGARVAIAVGLSTVVVPLLFVGLAGLGLALSTTTITVALATVSIGGMLIGTIRRRGLPAAPSGSSPLGRWRAELADATFGAESRLDALLTVAVLAMILVAMTGFAFGLVAPERGDDYTEVALLDSQNDTLTAGNYPDTVLHGDPVTLTLTVENQEGRQVDYSVFVVLERVRTTDGELQVLERELLASAETTVMDDSTWVEPLRVQPGLLGENLRLSVYVLEGADGTVSAAADADHHLYVWIDVRTASTNVSTPSGSSSDMPNRVAG